MDMRADTIDGPYLLFLGESQDARLTKTASGVHQWCPEKCKGQLRLEGCMVDLGLPDFSPEEFSAAHASGTLVVGVAGVGGGYADSWVEPLRTALEHGLDIASGLHVRLSDIGVLAETAKKHGRRLIDVRFPPRTLRAGNGAKRTGRRLLTVGTDCAVGKMFTALAIAKEMKDRGLKADFRATGQTGILIAGSGISVDAVVADFISGAAEMLSPDNSADHWDVVEGQGALTHPGYAGVSLGLLHGSQPDALVLCHEAHRKHVAFLEAYKVADIEQAIEDNTRAARLTNPAAKVVGISVNTKSLGVEAAKDYIRAMRQRTGLPVCDPMRTGVGVIVDGLL